MQRETPTIVTASAARQIAEALRASILSGKIAVDERLPTEEDLAQQFGVSRPTIREALKRLAAEHLVQSRRGPSGGNFVKRPSIPEASSAVANSIRLLTTMGQFDFNEILEVRFELEKLACRFAAERATRQQISSLRRQMAEQSSADLDDVAFCESDVRFHQLIVEAAQNNLLEFVMRAMSEALLPVTNLLVFRFRERSVIIDQHLRLIDAIEAHDEALTLAILEEKTTYLRARYDEAHAWKARQRRARRRPEAP